MNTLTQNAVSIKEKHFNFWSHQSGLAIITIIVSPSRYNSFGIKNATTLSFKRSKCDIYLDSDNVLKITFALEITI